MSPKTKENVELAVIWALLIGGVYGVIRLLDKTTPWYYTATYCTADNHCYYADGDAKSKSCPPITDANFLGTTKGKLKAGSCDLRSDR